MMEKKVPIEQKVAYWSYLMVSIFFYLFGFSILFTFIGDKPEIIRTGIAFMLLVVYEFIDGDIAPRVVFSIPIFTVAHFSLRFALKNMP